MRIATEATEATKTETTEATKTETRPNKKIKCDSFPKVDAYIDPVKDQSVTGVSVAYYVRQEDGIHVLCTYLGDRIFWTPTIKDRFSAFMSNGNYPYHQYPFMLPEHSEEIELNGETKRIFKSSKHLSGKQVTCEVMHNFKQKMAEKLAEASLGKEAKKSMSKEDFTAAVSTLSQQALIEINSNLDASDESEFNNRFDDTAMNRYILSHDRLLTAMTQTGNEIRAHHLQTINIPRGRLESKHKNGAKSLNAAHQQCALAERFEELAIPRDYPLPQVCCYAEHRGRFTKVFYQELSASKMAELSALSQAGFQPRQDIHFMSAAEDFWPQDLRVHKSTMENQGHILLPLALIQALQDQARGQKAGPLPPIDLSSMECRYPLVTSTTANSSGEQNQHSAVSAAGSAGGAGGSHTLFASVKSTDNDNARITLYADKPDRNIAICLAEQLQLELEMQKGSTASMSL